METETIIYRPPIEMSDLTGLGSTYFEKMLKNKDLIAQTDALTNETTTYGSLLQKSIRTAIAMRSRGIKPNDVITICSYNTMNNFIPYYGSLFIGAVSANIDPNLPLSDTIHLLNLVRPKIVFVIPEALKLIEDALRATNNGAIIVVFGETSTYTEFSKFLLPSPEENDFVPYEVKNLKETAVVVFTSGSTGLPKGACLTHYGLLAQFYQLKVTPLPPGLVVLTYANLYWISAIALTHLFVVNGMNRLICSKFDPKEVRNIIKKFKVTGAYLNTFHLSEVCKHGPPEEDDIPSLEYVFYGGSLTTIAQAKYFKKCFPTSLVINGYGQTEAWSSVFTFNTASIEDMELLRRKPHCVGRPIAGCCYKIVDPETEKTLGPNQEGELRIKSDYFMNGYYGIDSKDAWDSEGFLKTGDIAHYDEDQCFFILNKIKDLLKYKMWHVSPAKLEMIILTHPTVHNCVVIGIPHQTDGDLIMGVVVLKDSYIGKVTEEEVQQYVNDQVGYHQKLRGGVRFVKELPLTVTNKIDRRKTKTWALTEFA